MLATNAALQNKAKAAAIADFTVRLIKAENWVKTHQSTYVTDYYVNLFHLTTAEAQLILKAGGTYKYVALNGSGDQRAAKRRRPLGQRRCHPEQLQRRRRSSRRPCPLATTRS